MILITEKREKERRLDSVADGGRDIGEQDHQTFSSDCITGKS